jgi:Xaa-Pro aminopeptidase
LPTARPFETGELVLIDAGADVRGYACNVTRTYPASGAFTPEQEALHGVVAAACSAAIERCSPRAEWLDVHRAAATVIAEGLADFGLLRGEAATLVESGAASLFFPHGIGHMVGLGFGGIRIEHNVLVTEDGREVLTADVPCSAEPTLRPRAAGTVKRRCAVGSGGPGGLSDVPGAPHRRAGPVGAGNTIWGRRTLLSPRDGRGLRG